MVISPKINNVYSVVCNVILVNIVRICVFSAKINIISLEFSVCKSVQVNILLLIVFVVLRDVQSVLNTIIVNNVLMDTYW